MGGGSYSFSARAERSIDLNYETAPLHEIYKAREIKNSMNPKGVHLRESRDSQEHPDSLAIILALDLTGSMGQVPHQLVKNGLPKIMSGIMQQGIKDPQILFLGVGDHECDKAPLQVGQFESNDELLDKWLTDIYLEGGGGGNDGESYLLAWYFAATRTEIDCFEKRGKKGFLFTIGDEPTLSSISKDRLKEIMGEGEYMDYSAEQLLNKAKERYHVYHLHMVETYQGKRQATISGWREFMGDNLIVVQDHSQVASTISDLITIVESFNETKVTQIDEENKSDSADSSGSSNIPDML